MSLFVPYSSRPKAPLSPPPPPLSSKDREKDPAGRYALSGMASSSSSYDVEAGSALPHPRTLRRALARRGRVLVGTLAVAALIYYLSSSEPSLPPPPASVPVPVFDFNDRLGAEDIWDELPPPIVEGPAGQKAKVAAPPPPLPPRPDDPRYYVIDKNGDHFLTNIGRKVAPLHPSQRDMLDPDTLFADVDIDQYLKPPAYADKFPDSRLPEIASKPLPADRPWVRAKLPDDSFAAQWTGPEDWEAPTPGVKDMEWSSFKTKDRGWESSEQREQRIKRRDAVKRGFVYAWQAYKNNAWGHDEVRPLTGNVADPFNGWGASIVDTLDTLIIMGLQDEYNLCRPHVNQLNFHWITGRDWSQGYKAPESEGGWTTPRSTSTGLPVFESGIRYLGGLLGAYDLTGDQLMLDRATDIAEILGRAFNTRSGLPQGSRIDPGQQSGMYTLHTVSIAEVGSMTLELIRLSQATGDRQWFDLAQRCIDYIDQKAAPRSVFKPMLPMGFIADSDQPIRGSFSMGAMTDSYYEYLIKAYKLLGGGELAKPYKRLYTESIDVARKLIFADVTVVPNRELFTIGKYENDVLKVETEHLACFAGGMLGMGAKLLDRPQDMTDGARFTTTCYWIGAGTPMGIQPEVVEFAKANEESAYVNKTTYGYNWHPPIKRPFTEAQFDKNTMYRQGNEILWNDDHTPVRNDSGRTPDHPITYYRSIRGHPPGSKHVTRYYINRPETIESVFYMYRLTGDRGWQDKGWRMFGSWMNHSRVDHGISSIHDVTKRPENVEYGDNMESFIFAETFKYHYLLQSDPDLLSLDDYVLNTEAHPFIANYGRDMEPGSQGLWDRRKVNGQELGHRGQGTDVQKWARLKELEPTRRRQMEKLKGKRDTGSPWAGGVPGQMPRRW